MGMQGGQFGEIQLLGKLLKEVAFESRLEEEMPGRHQAMQERGPGEMVPKQDAGVASLLEQ